MQPQSEAPARWRGRSGVLFINTFLPAPTMHLFREVVHDGGAYNERTLCGRVIHHGTWLAFRHAVKFGVKCSKCDRIASREKRGQVDEPDLHRPARHHQLLKRELDDAEHQRRRIS